MVKIQVTISGASKAVDQKAFLIASDANGASSFQRYIHDLAGALDRINALALILKTKADLPESKRQTYAAYLDEAHTMLEQALKPQMRAIESVLDAEK